MGDRQSRPWVVSDELWSLIEPLLPVPGPTKVEGRPRVPDRHALCGILLFQLILLQARSGAEVKRASVGRTI
ncbi:hypothetical protein GCM10023323_67730 [Streptomyces thinghirensis]|uniref:Transposase n=1 Tax=Streptomyces thinghirensis TaxID=551547 RepID=A0ABP9TGB6_9ACTN